MVTKLLPAPLPSSHTLTHWWTLPHPQFTEGKEIMKKRMANKNRSSKAKDGGVEESKSSGGRESSHKKDYWDQGRGNGNGSTFWEDAGDAWSRATGSVQQYTSILNRNPDNDEPLNIRSI